MEICISSSYEMIYRSLLEGIPHDLQKRRWLQQDDVSAHHSAKIRDHRNEVFPNKWLGRNGCIRLPTRSPNFRKLDFFVWGYIRNIVLVEQPTCTENMLLIITNAFPV